MSYIRHLDERFITLKVKPVWEYHAIAGWGLFWRTIKRDRWDGIWELGDYCSCNSCKLVCITRGWFCYYATLRVESQSSNS